MWLLITKLMRPGRVCLLRGNHESRSQHMTYGFYEECIRKFQTAEVWRLWYGETGVLVYLLYTVDQTVGV